MLTGFLVLLFCLFATTQGAKAEWVVHVTPSASADGDGRAETPFRTLLEARDAIRAARASGQLLADQTVTVVIGEGDYALQSSFELAVEDGGSEGAPVVYRAAKPNSVRIHGGVALSPATFKPVVDNEMLQRLNPQVREQIRVCDLTGLTSEFQQLSNAFKSVPNAPWLYVDRQPMTLARWPNADAENGGWASFSKVIDTGMADPSATNLEHQKKHPGAFEFDDPRPAHWNLGQGVWLRGYWTHDWSDEVIRIASYDKEKKTIKLAEPHAYGIMSGTWGRASRRFYALNVFEELDQSGEWYLDRKNKQLYLYPPENFQNSKVVLATLSEPLVKIHHAKHITLQGLSFCFGHGDGIVLRNTDHVQIDRCEIANLARSGITVNGSNNTVRSCNLFNLGTAGISLSGGDRHTLTAANNLAVNNHIHDYGLFQRTYAAGIDVNGCGQIVHNNTIHDAPHNAVLYRGNEHRFERNEVYRVVMETGDAGAFYSGRDWTSQGNVLRHNYIHDLGSGDADHVNTMGVYLDDCDSGDTIEGNVFYRAGRAIMIGGGRDNPVINNLVIDCPIGLHMDARGMTWEHWNNPQHAGWNLEEKAESLDYRNPPWSDRYPRLAKIMSDSPREPLYNPIRNNVFVNVTSQVWNRDKNVEALMDKFEIADNLVINTTGATTGIAMANDDWKGFANLVGNTDHPVEIGFVDFANQNFQLRDDAELLKKLPTFQPIPMDKIGIDEGAMRYPPWQE